MSTTGAIEATLRELQRRSLSIGADHLLAARLLGLERTLERRDLIRHRCGLNDSVQPSRTALHTSVAECDYSTPPSHATSAPGLAEPNEMLSDTAGGTWQSYRRKSNRSVAKAKRTRGKQASLGAPLGSNQPAFSSGL
jgi:hypothetical protein